MNHLQRTEKNDFWKKLRDVENIEAALAVLREVDEVATASHPSLNYFDIVRLRRSIFAALRDLTAQNPDQAQQLMLDHLLWRCLHVIPKEKGDGWETVSEDGQTIKQPSARQAERVEQHELREELAHWIESYNQSAKEALREAVIRNIVSRVAWMEDAAEITRAALWTLGAIGYRSPQVEDVLWRVMERQNAAGDAAFGTLAGMGVTPKRRAEFVQKLRERIPARPVRSLGYALQRIAEPSLLDAALELFQTSSDLSYEDGQPRESLLDSASDEERQNAEDYDLWAKLTMLSHFADALWDEEKVQDAMWDKMLASCGAIESGRSRLLLGGNLAPWCNTRRLPQDFLALMQDESDQEPKTDEVMPGHYAVYLTCLRLKESVRPWQIEGWEEVTPTVLSEVRRIALSDTEQSGSFTTSPMRAKEIAWQTLACAGGKWTSEEVQRAIAEERNDYAMGQVAEVVACFRCDPLPPIALDLLQQKLDLSEENPSFSRLSAARGAENLARATATRQAFEALLNFGLLYNGEVLRSTSDALDEVAVWLAREDEGAIAARLTEIATDEEKPPQRRIVAVSALHALAIHRRLPAEHWPELLQISEAPEKHLEDYYRSLAVQAIGFLRDSTVQSAVAPRLFQLSKSRADSLVALQAREALARHGTWRQEADDYLKSLGLESREGIWRVVASTQMDSQVAFIVGLLYAKSPQEFERAVCDVLADGSDEAIYALVRLLANEDETGQKRLSVAQARILIEDLFERSNSYRARLYLFEALACAAPAVLLEPEWREKWSQWLPDARVALADALGQVAWKQIAQRGTVSSLLLTLLGDGLYAVRRAAARAMSNVDAEFLAAVCRNWQQGSSVDERKRASEAAGWLESSPILRELMIDAEPTVRKAAERALNEQRNRIWAKKYRDQILSSEPDDIARSFKYGDALADVCDDEDLRRLQLHLTKDDVAPNIRFWISKLVDEMKKKWREQTQKWPEPWVQWQGIVHEANAVLRQNDKVTEVRVSLWQRPAEGIRGRSGWGGSIWPLQEKDSSNIDLGHAQLDIEEREPARILINHSSSTTLFIGQEYFPRNSQE